jgi:hypothetical protein
VATASYFLRVMVEKGAAPKSNRMERTSNLLIPGLAKGPHLLV